MGRGIVCNFHQNRQMCNEPKTCGGWSSDKNRTTGGDTAQLTKTSIARPCGATRAMHRGMGVFTDIFPPLEAASVAQIIVVGWFANGAASRCDICHRKSVTFITIISTKGCYNRIMEIKIVDRRLYAEFNGQTYRIARDGLAARENQMDHMANDGLDKYRNYKPSITDEKAPAGDLCITRCETFQTMTVYAPERDELSVEDAIEFATAQLGDDAQNWTCIDRERINYSKVAVRFQAL